MAPSFNNVTTVSALISAAISRRGYATASRSVVPTSRAPGVMLNKGKGKGKGSDESTWVPDPKTGYYRPANEKTTVDPVELRQMLIKTRSGASQ